VVTAKPFAVECAPHTGAVDRSGQVLNPLASGRYLVQAVTQGEPGERLYGYFPDAVLLPKTR
jgi:hypothetical protein